MIPIRYPNSLLFKISGKNSKTSSWLLGTMHMICAEDFVIKEKVLRSLHRCTHYYMEVDLGSAAELEVMHNGHELQISIDHGLSDKEKDELNEILIRDFEMTLDEAANLPPVALINKMTTNAIGCEEIKIAEMELLQLAQEAGLQTGGLETAMEQLNIAQQVFDGKEILQQMKSSEDYKHLFPKMVEAYHQENLFELASYVTDRRFMSPEAYKILVLDRNKRWAKRIPELVSAHRSFIAVGAGHLPGPSGILELLRKKGYAVNPVYR